MGRCLANQNHRSPRLGLTRRLLYRRGMQEKLAPPARVISLDVFRGATIASMILVNDPGTWSAVYPQLDHAVWNGWTFTDLIFPFFLWISGVAMTLSFARRAENGEDRRRLLLHVFRRAAIIFAIGL